MNKEKIWNEINKLIWEMEDAIIDEEWDKAADIYIKLSILIYKSLKD